MRLRGLGCPVDSLLLGNGSGHPLRSATIGILPPPFAFCRGLYSCSESVPSMGPPSGHYFRFQIFLNEPAQTGKHVLLRAA